MASIPDDVKLVGRPVYLALVDVACDDDFLELAKSALLAALEALPPTALFGVVTFSDKVGMYDLQGKIPLVKYVPLLDKQGGGSPTSVELGDAMALRDLLAPVGKCKETMYAALEGLAVDSTSNEGTVHRGFGGAVQAVLRLLSGLAATEGVGTMLKGDELAGLTDIPAQPTTENGQAHPKAMMIGFAGARLMCFLSGPPTFGPGKVMKAKISTSHGLSDTNAQDYDMTQSMAMLAMDPSFPINAAVPSKSPSKTTAAAETASQVTLRMDKMTLDSEGQATDVVVDPRGGAFYEEAASAAAALGVAVDLYIVATEVVGLDCLEPLASSSGGHVCWYLSVDDAALPQDVYRRLAGIQARNCRLRLRSSPEFRVQRCYGHLMADENYKNLQHIVSCSPHDCFAFDFEFASEAGFIGEEECPPTLQLAFQYTMLVPIQSDHLEAPVHPTWYRLERRMRIHTVQVAIARTPKEVYSFADPETILALLMHKIVRACQEEGLAEARSLLQDWLVILMAHYNTHVSDKAWKEVDVAFEACPALQPMARLVYVLLQSPLLVESSKSGAAHHQHPDLRCYLQNLWAALPPGDLLRAVYPILSSWKDPDTQAYPKHSLSRTALITAGAPIFLLDSFTHLIVYYTQVPA
mmetsp:Transcript_35145/g.91272  ORF Transcript_35145/g.91272 Transcript_35145/m.91272 type:complete len:638 (-) Transcript_35145:739-2652(-)